MTTLLVRKVPGVSSGRRPGRLQRARRIARRFARRIVAWLVAPGIVELDARTLADIGASQTLRAQAELRDAWRRGAGSGRWHSL